MSHFSWWSFFLGMIVGEVGMVWILSLCYAAGRGDNARSRADAEIERAVADEVKRRADDDTRGMVEIVDDFTIRDWSGKEVKHGKQ